MVPQGSILGPLLFLMYIDDLGSGLSLSNKLFADDISLFSVVHIVTQSTTKLNHIDKKQKNSLERKAQPTIFLKKFKFQKLLGLSPREPV